MYLKDITLGIDFSNTIVHNDSDGNKVAYPRALEVITECCLRCHNVYIISKVNEQQRERALRWLEESGFHEKTGLPKDNVFFCGARNQKGIIDRKLRVNCFIDDMPEVMSYIDTSVYRILYCPAPIEVQKFNMRHIHTVYEWSKIEKILFEGNI